MMTVTRRSRAVLIGSSSLTEADGWVSSAAIITGNAGYARVLNHVGYLKGGGTLRVHLATVLLPIRELPLRERRGQLEEVVENDHTLIFPARRLVPNGLEAWARAVSAGYEGSLPICRSNSPPSLSW